VTSDTRLYATPGGIALGPLADIPDGGARGFRVQLKTGRFDGVVIRTGDTVTGYVDLCPHAGVPLASGQDDYEVHQVSTGTLLACRWHGALFQVENGVCVAGPCKGQRLEAWPVAVRHGVVVTDGVEQARGFLRRLFWRQR
jgi:nitrite reductase/ring-hydroxylating ferredoxin subunit